MKKIFTIATALIASMAMMAADVTYALTDMTLDGSTYSKSFESSVKAKGNNIFIEVPAQNIKGNVTFVGESNKADRYLYICDSTGTKTTTGIQMLAAGASISYLPKHIVKKDNKFYLKFNTSHDFKYMSFSYNYEEYTADHTKATVTDIQVGGESLAGFTASEMTYNIELEFDATAAPVISAETADDATVQVTQAAAVPGAATVVCTSYDQTNSVTYTINFTLESPAPFIRATLTSGTAATVKGSIGGTADVSLSSNLKMDKGKYFGIALPEGQTFMEGDSVVIRMSVAGQNYPCLFADKEKTNLLYLATETSTALEYTIMLPAAADGISTLYMARDADDATYKWNPTLKSISVFRPVDDGQPKLNVNKEAITLNVTAEQPSVSETLVFSGKHLTPGTYNLVVPNLAGLTVAPTAVTVAEDGKLNASVVVTYATEADVEAASTAISLTIGALVAEVAINYSAVQAKAYINASVNIEGGIVADGKSFGTVAALQAAGWEIAQVDGNDSLNNSKGAGRNEDYLGLKLNKSTAAYLAGWVRQGDVLRVKFGNIPTAVLVSLNNGEAIEHTAAVYEYTATEDTYVKFAPKATNSKLVLKQVMLNAAIVDVMYKVTYAAAENGEVSGWTVAFPGESVELSFAPAAGYMVMHCYVNETEIHQSAPGATITFTMPEEAVTVNAVFALPTDIDNTEEAVKTVKFFENGQLMIMKNGVKYNAQGARVL